MTKDTKKFLLWTFIVTFGCWGAILVANQFGYLKYGTPLAMIIYLVGGLGPTIVAYFSLKQSGRISGVKDFFKETFNVKQSWKGYVLILALLSCYFVIPFTFNIVTYYVPIYMLPIVMISNVIGGGLEELGWRHILQRQLEEKYSFIIATLITSVIWAVWHLPLFFIEGTSQQTLISFWNFSILVVGFSFVLATVYRMTKSIWMCVLCHVLINSLNSCFLFLDKVTLFTSCMISGLLTVISIAIILYSKRKNRSFEKVVKQQSIEG